LSWLTQDQVKNIVGTIALSNLLFADVPVFFFRQDVATKGLVVVHHFKTLTAELSRTAQTFDA
jgi:hypothetical protein